ncbi:hypothetical protein JCM8547_004508 [Rhodosporidiobolus lusitaniae]
MASLLNLPGKLGGGRTEGYAPLGAPVKQHTVSAGGIQEPIELGDIGVEGYWAEVASIREGIKSFELSLDTLRTKQLTSLQSPTDELTVELNELAASLSLQSAEHRSRIAKLGEQVGKDEARRSHWENLKAQLQRAVAKWQAIEQGQREKVKERVARQMKIVNPAVTDEEIKAVVDTSSASSAPQIFQQAVSGRSTAAMSALNEVKSRHSELQAIESTIIELAALMQQVADLVVVQDSQFIHLESTAKQIDDDVEAGAVQVTRARLSAAAARHKRKLCAGFALILVIVLAVVIGVSVSGGKGGSSSSETKTETVSATGTETAKETATTEASQTSAAAVRW